MTPTQQQLIFKGNENFTATANMGLTSIIEDDNDESGFTSEQSQSKSL